MLSPRKNKYGNKKTVYNGRNFDSKKEADYCQLLDVLKSTAIESLRVNLYEMQVPYLLEVNGIKICKYILDFKVYYADGRTEHIDIKGYLTPVFRIKKKLMKAIHNIDIIEK